jgi:hypothetical protein
VTWATGDDRVSRPFGPDALEEAASLEDADLVAASFSGDRTRLIF